MAHKITSFEQLIAWQKAIDLAVVVYKSTDTFPKSEQFGITNQLRRASSSVSANIAEGFGRKTNKDKSHFYIIAYGSLMETKSFLHLSQRLGYIPSLELYSKHLLDTQKLLSALVRSTDGRAND